MKLTMEYLIVSLVAIFTIIGFIKTVVLMFKSGVGFFKISVYVLLAFLISAIFIYVLLVYTILGLVVSISFLIKRLFKKRKPKKVKVKLNDENSFYLNSEKGTIRIANPYRGILVAGGAGSGKSASLFYPLIKQCIESGFSGICYDFKSPELSEFAYAIYKLTNANTNFSFLNFKNHSVSDRINPLSPQYLTKQAIAFEMASVLMNNLLPENIKKPDYWSRSSISVIAGAIWYLRNNHPKQCTLPHLIAMMLFFPSGALIDLISKDMECLGMISSIKEAREMNAERQLSGVIGTIKNALSQLNFPELFYLLSADNVNLDLNNPDSPTFLSIGNDSTLSTTYAPVISLIISVCMRKMNEPNKAKSVVLLDEVPTLYIPNLEQIPATARSNKICTIIGLQDYSQMVDKYGQDKAQVLISNLGNQFYGRTVNERTAKMISALFGRADKTYNTKSRGDNYSDTILLGKSVNSSNVNINESIQERDRVKVSDITNLPAGKFYGVIAEGNHTELMGVQLSQSNKIYEPFEKKEEIDTSKVFKAIYDDVKGFADLEDNNHNSENKDFEINLN